MILFADWVLLFLKYDCLPMWIWRVLVARSIIGICGGVEWIYAGLLRNVAPKCCSFIIHELCRYSSDRKLDVAERMTYTSKLYLGRIIYN